MASIMTSMPLFGDSRPNVRMTDLPLESELGLGRVGLDKGDVRNAVRDDLDLVGRHVIDAAQQLAALLGHHDDLRRGLDDALHHARAACRRLGQHRMQRRHDRHGQARQQHQDVLAGFAAENAELVLQRDDVEAAGVQEVRGTQIFFELVVLDLQATAGG